MWQIGTKVYIKQEFGLDYTQVQNRRLKTITGTISQTPTDAACSAKYWLHSQSISHAHPLATSIC